MKVLILFAHPAFHKSKVNKIMVDGLADMEGITFHDLYEEYPDFNIDVKREQELLSQHDVIIMQFPLFWYSTPAILKEWQDHVYEHGWAFGSKGVALKDKLFMCSITTGAPREAYKAGGFHNHTLPQLISPLQQSARLCKMISMPPFVVHGSHSIEENEVREHKKELMKLCDQFKNDRFDLEKAMSFEYMNDYLNEKG